MLPCIFFLLFVLSAATFEYAPLDKSRPEIRIERLKSIAYTPTPPRSTPSTEVKPLYRELLHCCLDDKPDYYALSYVWGDPSDQKVINISYAYGETSNGQATHANYIRTPVTKNLRAALEHLQDPHHDVTIWIDALCINQADDEEKTEQVKRMKTIYAGATRTEIWLGPADEDSDVAMAEIYKIGAQIESHNARGLFYRLAELPSSADGTLIEDAEKPILDLMSGCLTSALRHHFPIAAFNSLLARPYWRRVWVIQEFVVSSRMEIICGSARAPFQYFQDTMMFVPVLATYVTSTLGCEMDRNNEYSSLDYVLALSERAHPGAGQLCGTRRRFQEHPDSERLTLFRLLAKAHVDNSTNATEPKDKIFALLGMATDATALAVLPDYKQSITIAYTALARAIIGHGHIDLLSLCQFPRNDPEHALPSWVPDWRITLHTPSGRLPWESPFEASGAESSQRPSTNGASSPTQLILQGYRVDVIEAVKTEWRPGPEGCTKNTKEVAEYMTNIISLCLPSNEKAAEQGGGVEIYADLAIERQRAHIYVPIADQEHYSMGFVRRATASSRLGQAEVLKDVNAIPRAQPHERPEQGQEMQSYYSMMGRLRFRRPFISVRGFVGLASHCAEAGDVVVVSLGAKLPYVLRGKEDGTHVLVGEAYVHGIMYGEFV